MIMLTYESDGESYREIPDNDDQIVELREMFDENLEVKFSTGELTCQST